MAWFHWKWSLPPLEMRSPEPMSIGVRFEKKLATVLVAVWSQLVTSKHGSVFWQIAMGYTKPLMFSTKFLTQWHSRPRIPSPSYSMLFLCESSNCLGFQTLFFAGSRCRTWISTTHFAGSKSPNFPCPSHPGVSPEPTSRTLGSSPSSPPESVPAGWWEASLQPSPWHGAHAAGSQQLHDWACFEENELVTYTIHGAHGVDFTEVTFFDVFLFFKFSSINISYFT